MSNTNSYSKSGTKMVKSSENFKFSFLVVSFIGFICCLDRSDYNVALGIFAFLLWSQSHFPQKHRILWIVFLTIFGDLIWIITVSVVQWNKQAIQNYNLRTMTQVAAIVNMIYKIVLIAYSMCSYDQCSDLFTWSSFKTKVLYL